MNKNTFDRKCHVIQIKHLPTFGLIRQLVTLDKAFYAYRLRIVHSRHRS